MDEEDGEVGAPAWMVSFGDMMTLILTFFILLVSMSTEQQTGLVAKGVGSFIVAMKSFGLDGLLTDNEEAEIFQHVRIKFNLPPEEDPDRRTKYADAAEEELIRAIADGLEPNDELTQPTIATFESGSAELSLAGQRYLEIIAETLRPVHDQVLVLEGHSSDSGRQLSFVRARVVRDYLVDELGFAPDRIEVRAWYTEIDGPAIGTRSVDARLITPRRADQP